MTSEWLNYHHLYYFFQVAKAGSIAKASKVLRLSQPTISGQIKSFESALEHKLFEREGRGLRLSEFGERAYEYAERIFELGDQFQRMARHGSTERSKRFKIGVSDRVVKLLAYDILAPALDEDDLLLVCTKNRTEHLLADLARHELDAVLVDEPIGPQYHVKAYNHLLLQSRIGIYGRPELVKKFGPGFPKSLHGAPFLMPAERSVLRRELDRSFVSAAVVPKVVAEFDDTALMRVFGEQGKGLFPYPEVMEERLGAMYGLARAGILEDTKERFFLVTLERKVRDPIVLRLRAHYQGATKLEAGTPES